MALGLRTGTGFGPVAAADHIASASCGDRQLRALVRRSHQDPLGTWATNVQGSLHVLEALKPLQHPCAVVMVTTDKVYENQE